MNRKNTSDNNRGSRGQGRGSRGQEEGSRGQGRGSRGQGRGGPSQAGESTVRALGQQQQPQRPQTQLQGVWARRVTVPQTPATAAVSPSPPASQAASGDAVWAARQGGGAVPRTTQGAVPRTTQVTVPSTIQGAVPSTTQEAVLQEPIPSTAQTSRAVRGEGRRLTSEPIRTRPESNVTKQGTSGRAIALKTNHLFLSHPKQFNLYQYRVDFVPNLDLSRLKKGLFRTAFADVLQDFLFDGTVLYTTGYFDRPVERVVASNRDETFKITMRHVGNLVWGDYQYIPLLNIIIRKCLKLMKFELIRREYFDVNSEIPFRFGDTNFNIWPGIFTSTRQCEDNIMLNIDVLFKVTRRDNAFDLFLECSQSRNARQAYLNQVLGTVVMTTYNNKTYKVDDVDFNSTPLSTFPKADGTRVSYVDYFRTRYNVVIRDPNQPFMLISRASRREIRGGMSEEIRLVPELCLLTGLTNQQRENFVMMRELGRITRLSAPERVRQLTEFARKVNADPAVTAEIRKWDVGIADKLLQLQGRQLPCETVYSGGRASYPAGPKADWGRELRNKEMFRQKKIAKMAVITPAQHAQPTRQFMTLLAQAATNMRWDIGNYRIFEIGDDRALSYINMIDKLLSSAMPDLFLIVLPKNSLDRYGAVKMKCTCDRGVLSQFVLARQLVHKNAFSIATNIAVQINAKNLGAPWTVPIPLSSVMVVGYDVCRDTVRSGKCFAAMVASMDKCISQYYSHVYEHKNEEELSNCIGTSLVIACGEFKRNNRGTLPERILLYRDGVGDGQLEYVKEHEVANAIRMLTELYGQKSLVKLTYIIVSKRINVKFFTMDNQNPPPGTIVDNVVTQPERYDFYLSSQCVNQGTVSPTSYNVIYDTMGLQADQLQLLTNKLCHLYYNWAGTIKVPAPVQYAHKLAFQTSQALHRSCHPNLQHSLHFL